MKPKGCGQWVWHVDHGRVGTLQVLMALTPATVRLARASHNKPLVRARHFALMKFAWCCRACFSSMGFVSPSYWRPATVAFLFQDAIRFGVLHPHCRVPEHFRGILISGFVGAAFEISRVLWQLASRKTKRHNIHGVRRGFARKSRKTNVKADSGKCRSSC